MPARLRRIFWQPPRAHGDVIEDRTVSFLELFYDLIYVVVIARVAHRLAEDVSWRGVAEFAVVFGLIWLGWINATFYIDLHGREDGRTRVFTFAQMLLLALLAVFAADAAGEDGTAFALTLTAFLGVLTWLWYSVRRQDTAEYQTLTGFYLAAMALSVIVIAASAALPDDGRLVVWAVFVLAWVAVVFVLERWAQSEGRQLGGAVTHSLVERFGLFVIIVLGEVVVGVVTGMSDVERNMESMATGVVGLMIGFGLWWTYFDFVSGRLPRTEPGASPQWTFGHLPVTMAIAASGAAMVSRIEHANDTRAPTSTAWLLAGSVALALVALIGVMRALADYERLASIYRPVSVVMVAAAGAALLAGWWRPAPWLLVLSLVAILAVVWWFAVDRLLRLDDPGAARPGAG